MGGEGGFVGGSVRRFVRKAGTVKPRFNEAPRDWGYSTGQRDGSITRAFHACKDAILHAISTQIHANYTRKTRV